VRPARRRSLRSDKPADVKGTSDVAPSDVATAIKYCRIAGGSSRRALYQLGRAYAAGGQTERGDRRLAQGGRQGLFLGDGRTRRALRHGSGVARDEAQARKLFERAAQAGNPRGVSNLAALGGGGTRPIRAIARAAWQKPPRPMRRRNISSA
jgi:TPR repeat protein